MRRGKRATTPDRRSDYNKPISATTIGNYVRNIKVFFNYLFEVETAISKNPCEKIEKHQARTKSEKDADAG